MGKSICKLWKNVDWNDFEPHLMDIVPQYITDLLFILGSKNVFQKVYDKIITIGGGMYYVCFI